ncbi:MAG: hypothetical protein ACXVJO_18090 [Thermoanaerobaculia bacterium]
MRQLLVALVLIFGPAGRAHANEGDETLTKLVQFAHDACDFLRANWPEPPQPLPTAETLAPHFGKVIGTTSRFNRRRITLAVPTFPGWKVTFEGRAFEMTLPRSLKLSVADFEARLGVAHAADIDVAMRADSAATSVEPERLDLPRTKDRPSCAIRLTAAGGTTERAKQRVISFRFDD